MVSPLTAETVPTAAADIDDPLYPPLGIPSPWPTPKLGPAAKAVPAANEPTISSEPKPTANSVIFLFILFFVVYFYLNSATY
jgi:hypothetical protein